MSVSGVRDRGSASLEAAIVFPALVLVALFLFGAMRVQTANAQVQSAARAGARAATTGSSPADAGRRARRAVSDSLRAGSACAGAPSVSVRGFSRGAPVTVTISCVAETVFGAIGPRSITGSATELVSDLRGGLTQ